MSAFRWVAFVISIGLLAVVGAVLNEFVNPLTSVTSDQATTQASQQGLSWYTTAWDWMPLIVLILLLFALIYGIIVRKRRVTP